MLEPVHLGVASRDRNSGASTIVSDRDQVRPLPGGDQGTEPAIGETDEVRARVQQRDQVGGVVLEVLAIGGRAAVETAPARYYELPAFGERRLHRPRVLRPGPAVHQDGPRSRPEHPRVECHGHGATLPGSPFPEAARDRRQRVLDMPLLEPDLGPGEP